MFAILKSYFPSRLVSSEVKMLALALTVINFVPALFGTFWFVMILPLYGLWVYSEQFQTLKDKRGPEEVRLTTNGAIYYNCFLLAIVGFLAADDWSIDFLYLFTYLGSVIGLNLILLRVLRESQIDNRA
ncbi:MAG: hypothetical protein AB8H47_07210 [Bacteroidia bacterium]